MKRILGFILVFTMIFAVLPLSASAEELAVFASGYNRGRGENDLIIYTPAFGATTNTNVYGIEAVVDADGKIISVSTVGNSEIPVGGFVISGHGYMADWVTAHCKVGKYASFNQKSLELKISDSPIAQSAADMFYSVSSVFYAMNSGRGENQLIVYTDSGSYTGTNEWGYEVTVQDGKVVSVGGNNSLVPENGFVLSGHGSGATWLGGNAVVGMKASYDESTSTVTLEMDGEAYLKSIDTQIAELEAKYNAALGGYLYCDYEYISSCIEELTSLRNGYSSLSTDEERGNSILSMDELVKHAITACGESRPVEYRGVWVIPTQTTQEEVGEYVQRLYDAGINTISVEALFNSTLICTVPKDSLFEHNPRFEGFDVLQAYILECHKRGMELHVWMPVFCVTHTNEANFEKSVWYKKPEWRMINDSGRDTAVKSANNQCFLNPAHPEVQDFLLETYKYIIETYDIDGFELDYIRYPSRDSDDWGYDDITIGGFEEKYGYKPQFNTQTYYWNDWAQYRCDVITEFVTRLGEMVDEIAPDVLLSADVGTNAESAPEGIYQDFAQWVENGAIDLLKPMSYSLESISMTDANVKVMEGRYLAAGVGAYSDMYNSFDVANHVIVANGQNADGVMFFEAATYLGKGCSDYLLETGSFRNSAVTPTYDPENAAGLMLDYAVGRIDDVLVPLGGIAEAKGETLKTAITDLKSLVSEDKAAAISKATEIIASLDDNTAENTLKTDLEYFCKILENISDNPRTPPEGPSVTIEPETSVDEGEASCEASEDISEPASEESEASKGDENADLTWLWIAIAAVAVIAAAVVVIIKKKK